MFFGPRNLHFFSLPRFHSFLHSLFCLCLSSLPMSVPAPDNAPSTSRDYVRITSDPLEPLSQGGALVGDAAAGAVATFVGTTRDSFQGKRSVEYGARAKDEWEEELSSLVLASASGCACSVLRLEYEAYEPMALKQLQSVSRRQQSAAQCRAARETSGRQRLSSADMSWPCTADCCCCAQRSV